MIYQADATSAEEILASTENAQRRWTAGMASAAMFQEPGDIENRILTFIASAEEPNRDGMLLRVAGVDWTQWTGLMPLCHVYSQPPVGKWLAHASITLPNGQPAILARGQFMPPDIFPNPNNQWAQLADACFAMYHPDHDFARSVSAAWLNKPGGVKQMKGGLDFHRSEILEISACFLQMNRPAVRIDQSILKAAVEKNFLTADLAAFAERVFAANTEEPDSPIVIDIQSSNLGEPQVGGLEVVRAAAGSGIQWHKDNDPAVPDKKWVASARKALGLAPDGTQNAGMPSPVAAGASDEPVPAVAIPTGAPQGATGAGGGTPTPAGAASAPDAGAQAAGAGDPQPIPGEPVQLEPVPRMFQAGMLSDQVDELRDTAFGAMTQLARVMSEMGWQADRLAYQDASASAGAATVGFSGVPGAHPDGPIVKASINPSDPHSPHRQALRFVTRAMKLAATVQDSMADAQEALQKAAGTDGVVVNNNDQGAVAAGADDAYTSTLDLFAGQLELAQAGGKALSKGGGGALGTAVRRLVKALAASGTSLEELGIVVKDRPGKKDDADPAGAGNKASMLSAADAREEVLKKVRAGFSTPIDPNAATGDQGDGSPSGADAAAS